MDVSTGQKPTSCIYSSDEEFASLDEFVVRPGKGDHRVERADGSTCAESYWIPPHRRQQAQIAAIPDTKLAAVVNLWTESGIDLAQSPLAKEYLKRKFRLCRKFPRWPRSGCAPGIALCR